MINQTTEKQQTLNLNHDRFHDNLPRKPYCTTELAAGIRVRPKSMAIRMPYIQHNPPAQQFWMTFDIDHEQWMPWEDARLPEPNFVVRNLNNRKSHIHYAIQSVCTSDAASIKPLQYLAAIERAYCEALNADRGYTGLITKNPYSLEWAVMELHQQEWSLGELADYVDLKPAYWTRKRAANDSHYGLGRNCAMFHRLRFWAYDHVTHHRESGTTEDVWMNLVLERAESENTFDQPLPYSEIKATAKSVGKWVWQRYWPEGKRIRRGIMSDTFNGSQMPLDLTTRQRHSARRTNEIRKDATREKIIQAVGNLVAAGKRVSVRSVAAESGCSTRTIQKHNDLIKN